MSSPGPVPPNIAQKYLAQGSTYYFADQTVAFVDGGQSLTARTLNKAIIEDLVTIAQARDWQRITVSGSESFRREVWKAATAQGLEVRGYVPTDLERRALAREGGVPSETAPTQRASERPTDASAARPARDPSNRSPASEVRVGTLIAHGEAPYRHDPREAMSYFVTIREESGREQTTWGIGLKEALEISQTRPQTGDVVGIRRTSSTPVTVTERTVSADGEILERPKSTIRYAWQVEKVRSIDPARAGASATTRSEDKPMESSPGPQQPPGAAKPLTPQEEAAAAIRSAATTREELQLKYPQLNEAVFRHLASHDQFADAYVKNGLIRESDRAQVIAQMRERLARNVEQGRVIRDPDNKEVSTLIRRSVNRVAADIGRPPLEIESRSAPRAAVRDDAPVRA
jgi:hypothetical protein